MCLSERHNHARELARDADLSQWDAFVIVSGDGLLFEVDGDTCTTAGRGNTHLTQQEFQLKRFTQLVPKWISDEYKLHFKTLLVGKSGNIAPPPYYWSKRALELNTEKYRCQEKM